MKYKIVDKQYHFLSAFDDETGAYVRTGIIKNGKDTGADPFMASFPHLIDVGIWDIASTEKLGCAKKQGLAATKAGPLLKSPI